MTQRTCCFIDLDYTLYVRFNSSNISSLESYIKGACCNVHAINLLKFEKRTKKNYLKQRLVITTIYFAEF